MDQEHDKRKKSLMNAIDQPHLLVSAMNLTLKSGKAVEGFITQEYDLEKLQYALANNCDEKFLQKLIDFFTEALKRHLKIQKGVKAEVIKIDDKPIKGR
jgi:hypothetical protein